MIDGFELNEELKDSLLLNHKAKNARSEFFSKGVTIIPEPFLETIIYWESKTDISILYKAVSHIMLHKMNIDKKCYMTNPELEFSENNPKIIWAIFNND